MKNAKCKDLQRHFIWAHRFRRLYYDEQTARDLQVRQPSARPSQGAQEWFLEDAGMFLAFWYVNLFEVIELLGSTGVDFGELRDDLVDHYHALRRFRNAVTRLADQQGAGPARWRDHLFATLCEPASIGAIDAIHRSIGNQLYVDFNPDDMPSL